MRAMAMGTLVALLLSGCGGPTLTAAYAGPTGSDGQAAHGDRRIITVVGEGSVRVAPDLATSTVAVEAQAREAAVAQEDVNRKGQQIIAAWKALGVLDADIQTVGIDLQPEYARPELTDRPTLTGYRATLRMQVRSRPGRAGDLIDAALQAGANRLEGVQFTREAVQEPRKEAIQKAIEQAMDQARTALTPLSLSVIEVREIQVGQSYLPPIPLAVGGMDFARAEMASTPVQAGEVEVRAHVTVKASF